MKYTNSKSEKERPGVVQEFSGTGSPRVEVHFPDNPPKFKHLGIHKGHIFKRVTPLEPIVITNATSKVSESQKKSISQPVAKSTTESDETCKESRPKRMRKAPERLEY